MGGGLVAAARGLAFCLAFSGLTLAGAAALLAAPALVLAVLTYGGALPGGDHGVVWLGVAVTLVPCGVLGVRWVAGLTRRLAGKWSGVPIAVPYRPDPGGEQTSRWSRLRRWTGRLLADPATWRDLLWTAVNACGGCVLVAAPAGLVLYGLGAMVALGPTGSRAPDLPAPAAPAAPSAPGPALPAETHSEGLIHWLAIPLHPGSLTAWLAIPLGLAITALGLWAGRRMLPAYGVFARSMLGPTRQAELALRVRHLARTRSDAIDTGAAEMRRIERDLHDGAQARLVAMGMTLDAASQLLHTSPAAAEALLAEAKDSSVKALAELRDLVRGIHPPMLADRGLSDAVHGLALDLPLRVHFAGELPGRPPAPVESAAYFAVSELLANVSKHAGADQVWIDISHAGGVLRIGVTDDGRGGVDPARGTGLRGVERRLAAFDGVLAVSSPPGGPTMATMEIPCALSSPKTSSS
ncbi:sensor histidine kinase [Microbispora catharanthi]|uniref:histidine kinase n=1 Tax=Microbispora catharanthi TaxID=1712871 RepID=A0A5N6BHW9_9ACTN|nr:histidine kinase [Microbispora catharanthi]KAB8180627.1 sensor histidine kinase [Microbispora catharanthi]